jgi:hypothetical protein
VRCEAVECLFCGKTFVFPHQRHALEAVREWERRNFIERDSSAPKALGNY